MLKETTPAIIAENIPEELRERPQWVTWRYEERDGKPTKVPYTPHTSFRASAVDSTTWRPFFEAHSAYARGRCDGIGFVFSDDDPYCGIDLDKCLDPETGDIAPWAFEILDRVGDDAYTEVSPSGTGIHIIIRASVRGGGMRRDKVEMYSRARYFAITGRPL
jgi:primase-polymerase (primpol)-like protein